MRIKMLIEFDFDPETGEYTPVSQEIVKEGKTPKKSAKTKDDGSTEPIAILEENKLVLNSRAVEALGAQWEDKIAVIYNNQNGLLRPIISVNQSGNKLTKSNTIAFRGKNREKLSEFGSEFKLIPLEDRSFIMDGGIEIPYKEEINKKKTDPKIKVVEDDTPEVLPMEATLDGEGDEEIKEEFTFEL